METRQFGFTVVMNRQSGSHGGQDLEALIRSVIPPERLDQILTLEAGHDLRDLVRQGLARARASGGCLLLAGGDGTVNGALPLLLDQHEVPFAVLPLGTFNYFARSYGIDLDPETALTQLLDAQPVEVSVATINDQPFVINVSLGFFPRVIDAREHHQARFGRNRFVAVLSGVVTALSHRRDSRMLLGLDGKRRRIKSPMVSMVFNRHQIGVLNLNTSCIDQDKITVLITQPVSRLELLGLMARGAIGRLDGSEKLELECASEITIGVRRPSVRVAIDGETRRFTVPLRLRVHRRGLRLMVPAWQEEKAVQSA